MKKGSSSVCCMSKDYLHQKIFGHNLHMRIGVLQHVHIVPLYGFLHITVKEVSLGYAYGRVLQRQISHHKYDTYIVCPFYV
jgi:hypothetical protein